MKYSFKKKINLFYWTSKKHGYNKQNYGDLLSKYIVQKISGKKVKWVDPRKKSPFTVNRKEHYFAIGSIIHHVTKNSVVWGSGIIDFEQKIAEADFRAVRGPQTQKFLIDKGYRCPDIFGDPGLLLPKIFSPEVKKKYRLGIIPHYIDYPVVMNQLGDNKEILVIDLITDDIEFTTSQILSCENIISSSLHGIIISQAYNIPAVWVKFSENLFGNNIKYQDYFESLGIVPYEGGVWNSDFNEKAFSTYLNSKPHLPDPHVLEKIQKGLLECCPFDNRLSL